MQRLRIFHAAYARTSLQFNFIQQQKLKQQSTQNTMTFRLRAQEKPIQLSHYSFTRLPAWRTPQTLMSLSVWPCTASAQRGQLYVSYLDFIPVRSDNLTFFALHMFINITISPPNLFSDISYNIQLHLSWLSNIVPKLFLQWNVQQWQWHYTCN